MTLNWYIITACLNRSALKAVGTEYSISQISISYMLFQLARALVDDASINIRFIFCIFKKMNVFNASYLIKLKNSLKKYKYFDGKDFPLPNT